jgi:hypothetical protein
MRTIFVPTTAYKEELMRKRISIIALLLLPSVFVGCATKDSNNQVMGAGGGAAIGALLGQALGRDTKSTLIGAAIGAALGWGTVKLMGYKSKPVRSAEDDARIYGLSSHTDSPLVKIQRGTSNPKEVHAGDKVTINTDYSLQLPAEVKSTEVTEGFVLKKDGEKIADLPPKTLQYGSGGFLSEAVIVVPDNAKPGTYVIEHKVQAGSSYDVDESVFLVKG